MEASTVPAHDPAAIAATETKRTLADLLPVGPARLAVAVAGAALLAASFAEFGASGRALVGAVICPVLVLLAAVDIKHHLLPNAIVFPTILLVALIVAVADPAGFLEHLEAGLALGGFLFLFAAVFPSGLGMGDAKVGFLLGLALGSQTLPAMMLAFLALFVMSLWVLGRHGLAARKQSIPFGPFLAIGGIAAFFLT
jgi:leader peptidase (prepilin peptidase) / N-methyltransferase